ncbi:MAG: DMT family transporter [Chloroflexota bacterium]|nr:DMT family transporter [Chloroflexota bacterium]
MSESYGEVRRPAGLVPSGFSLLLAMMWGGNNVSLKASLDYAAPMQVGWMRFILGGLVTLAYMLIRRESLGLARHEVKPVLIIGLIFATQLAIMNVGQDLTSAGHGVALNSTLPIWTATLARFFIPSDRLTVWKAVALVVAYAGVLVVVFGDAGVAQEGVTLLGDVLSFISAGLLGFRIILLSNFAQDVSEAKLMLGQLIIGTVLLLAGSYIFESSTYTLEGRFWLALAYQGVVIAGVGFLANAWLVKRYLPSSITFYYFAQPIAGIILAWLMLGEDPGRGLIVGVVLLCAGAAAYSWESYSQARRVPSRQL